MTSSSNKSKTTIYHMFYCQKCGTSCPINTERCPHCKITILKPQKTMCQSACTGELDVFNANRHTLGAPGDFRREQVYEEQLEDHEFKKLRLAQAELKQLKENLARKREIPNSLMQVLQNLENDYQEMRRKVLSGVPLDQLRPLSVDCQRIASKGRYIPAEIAKIVLEDRQGSLQSQNSQLTVHGDSCTGRRDTPALQQQDPKERPAEINTEPESNTSEAWYDAEEDLESIKMEAHQKVDDGHLKIPEEDTMGCCDKKETDEDVLLYASELPCNVTENLMNIKESVTSPETLTHQHRTTTSSFDTIMAKLSERHPEASQQRIVNSLLELQANHQGFLSGLPLKAVVEMTSALLRHPPLAIKERFQKEDANKINGN